MAERVPGPVVVGYDRSQHGAAALHWAAAEASRRGASLHVVHAADYLNVVPGPFSETAWVPDRASRVAARVVAEGVERARKEFADLDITSVTLPGSPAAVLVAESRQASLLVVGTRGHGELAGALLGSVAFAVSAHARCPVVVVRGDGSRRPGPDLPVVVGIDGSAPSDAALRFAAGIAEDTSAELFVVAAWPSPQTQSWEAAYLMSAPRGEGLAETARRSAQELAMRAEETVSSTHPGVPVRRAAEAGSPAEVLADFSARASLVVVGARGRGGFAGLLLGSVSHAVIHRSSCPVAVAR